MSHKVSQFGASPGVTTGCRHKITSSGSSRNSGDGPGRYKGDAESRWAAGRDGHTYVKRGMGGSASEASGKRAAPGDRASGPAVAAHPRAVDAEPIRQTIETLFRYASEGNRISLRAFFDDKSGAPFWQEDVLLDPSAPETLLERATAVADRAANEFRPVVFCPPIATFRPDTSKAGHDDLAEGLTLSVECDRWPVLARSTLQVLLGPASMTVASGGEWVNPSTGEVEPKLHLHWRLSEPTRDAVAHSELKQARALATALIGGDASAIPLVHPMRWPGSWHRKSTPRLARVLDAAPESEIELSDALEALEEAVLGKGLPLPAAAMRSVDESTGGDLRAADDHDVVAALRVIPNPDLPWDEWNRMGMASWAATGGSEVGLEAFLEWSGRSSKFDSVTTVKRWAHYAESPPDRLGAGTLFWEAARAVPGWVKPSSAKTAAVAPATADEADPADLWGKFPPPRLPKGLLPAVLEEFASVKGHLMGADAGGIAAATLAACAAAIPDSIKIQVKEHDESWCEPARIWVALIGEPSTKKSPILTAAVGPINDIDTRLFREWQIAQAKHDSLPKDERPVEAPRQVRLRVEDTTTEAVQEVLKDSPEGILCSVDEMSGFFGRMEAYSGSAKGSAKDRSFWLRSFNGGAYAIHRIGRGASLIENLSISLLGGIQPDAIRKVAADSVDDGLLQRLLPIVLIPATLGHDAPTPPVARVYGELVEALHRMKPAVDEGGRPGCLKFDDGAQAIRRDLEQKHHAMISVETINRKLAAHIGKLDGLFARLCVIWHCVHHASADALPMFVTEATARRVADFMHGYLLRHAFAFYYGTLGLSDDHERLCNFASYILAHKKEVVSNRDIARGDRSMRKLDRHNVQRIFEQLEALGWLDQTPGVRPSDPPIWRVNPRCHVLFADRAKSEAERRKTARAIIQEAVRGRGRGESGDE